MKNLPVLLASLFAISSLVACADKEGEGFEDTSADTGVEVLDADLDGFDSIESGGTDCDDSDASVNPSKFDIVDDKLDNDCDGEIDGFRFNVESKVNSGDLNEFKYFASGAPEGMKFYAMVFIRVLDYADWDQDYPGYVTIRESGFIANAVITVDGDPETFDGTTPNMPPFMWDFPGLEDNLDKLSFILCSSDHSPMMASGSNCIVWGPSAVDAAANMQNVIDQNGMAVWEVYKNNDPIGGPEMRVYTSAAEWDPTDMSEFNLGFYAVPPVPESGM